MPPLPKRTSKTLSQPPSNLLVTVPVAGIHLLGAVFQTSQSSLLLSRLPTASSGPSPHCISRTTLVARFSFRSSGWRLREQIDTAFWLHAQYGTSRSVKHNRAISNNYRSVRRSPWCRKYGFVKHVFHDAYSALFTKKKTVILCECVLSRSST
jgi:hypothetical protein